MRARLTYIFAIVLITVVCLALTPSSVRAQRDQIGASPQQASPEIVQQMKMENRQAFTAAERAEFKKLHAADAEAFQKIALMMIDIANNSRRYTALEGLISGLDTTIDTRRLLIKNTTDIADLQKSRDLDKEERKVFSDRSWYVIGGLILLLAGTILKWLAEGKRQTESIKAADARDATLLAAVIAHMDDTAELRAHRHKALGIS